jgi:hypothetical protein
MSLLWWLARLSVCADRPLCAQSAERLGLMQLVGAAHVREQLNRLGLVLRAL